MATRKTDVHSHCKHQRWLQGDELMRKHCLPNCKDFSGETKSEFEWLISEDEFIAIDESLTTLCFEIYDREETNLISYVEHSRDN